MTRPKEPRPPSALVRLGDALADASRDFAVVCDQMDAAEDDASFKALVQAAAETQAVLEDRVDRFWTFREIVMRHAERDRERARSLRERARRIEVLLERIDQRVIERIEADPDKPWEGEAYRLRVQANGQPSLCVALSTERGEPAVRDVTLSDVLDPSVSLEIDDRFVRVVTHVVLDRKAVRAAIEAGETLPWARLERGRHLRAREL